VDVEKFRSIIFTSPYPVQLSFSAISLNGFTNEFLLCFNNVTITQMVHTDLTFMSSNASIIFNSVHFTSSDVYLEAKLVTFTDSYINHPTQIQIIANSGKTVFDNCTCSQVNLPAQLSIITITFPTYVFITSTKFINNSAEHLIYISSPNILSQVMISNTSFINNKWYSKYLIYTFNAINNLTNVLFSCNNNSQNNYAPPFFSNQNTIHISNISINPNCTIQCQPGSFPKYGVLDCINCPTGNVPSSDLSSCVPCPAGTFSVGLECPVCPIYAKQPDPGQDECMCFGFVIRDPQSGACNNYVFIITVVALLVIGGVMIIIAVLVKKKTSHEKVIIQYEPVVN